MKPKVTLVCNTYNHSKYISQAIESFVKQETTFNFEIVVHDDCSTDGTEEIIREYAKKYPNLIRPMYEAENQTSKGKEVTRDIVLPTVNSKYMCFCEGDDFLLSTEKLQKQYDYMESHSSCTLCTHAIRKVDRSGNVCGEKVGKEGSYNTIDILKEIAPEMHTSSMFFRTEDYKKMPKVFTGYTVGDLIARMYLTNLGYVHYIPEIMSAYRLFSENSWSSRMRANATFANKNLESTNRFFKEFDAYTNHRYSELISKTIDRNVYLHSYIAHNYQRAKTTKFYKDAPLKQKLIVNVGILFPKLSMLIRNKNKK